jgi:predicted transcriptional regulator
MTKLLEEAIEAMKKMPDAAQDRAAEFLLTFAAANGEAEKIDDETWAAIQEGLAQAERGEFVSDEEMAEFFRRHGA